MHVSSVVQTPIDDWSSVFGRRPGSFELAVANRSARLRPSDLHTQIQDYAQGSELRKAKLGHADVSSSMLSRL